MLAGAERLDKELMIGQMQGKFQLVVLANVGHIVHEVSCSNSEYSRRVTEFVSRMTHLLLLRPSSSFGGATNASWLESRRLATHETRKGKRCRIGILR